MYPRDGHPSTDPQVSPGKITERDRPNVTTSRDVPADVVEALCALSGSTPPAAADRILIVLDMNDRLGMTYNPDDADEACIAAAVSAIERHGPRLAKYARPVLELLPDTEWTAPNGDTRWDRFLPLGWIWGVLFPPLGSRLVHLDLDDLREAHSRLQVRWTA